MRMGNAGRSGVGVCMLLHLATYIICYAIYLLLVLLAGKGKERAHNFRFFAIFRIVGWASGLGFSVDKVHVLM